MNTEHRALLSIPLLALAGALVLAGIHALVSPRIAANERLAADRVVLDALQLPEGTALIAREPVADAQLLALSEPRQVLLARRDGQVLAIVLPLRAPDGYIEPIDLIAAITPAGKIGAVHVVAHRETPGLGDAIDASRSAWIEQFVGRSLESTPDARWTLKSAGGDFDGMTGATVTARAVIDAVHDALRYFDRHREQLLREAGRE
jgi:electron transport complex protein RnfG